MARKIEVEIIGDSKKFTKATTDAVKSSESMASKMTTSIKSGLGIGAGIGVFSMVEKGVGLVVDKMGEAIDMASDQAEALSKVNVVFGENATEVEKWANTAADSMGMTKTAALEASSTIGNLVSSMGIGGDAAVDMAEGVSQLAADLGSFNNVSSEEAFTAIQSGLLGEAEPMRRFGSALSAARVEAYALSSGMAKTKKEMTEAVKVQAPYQLILQDTTLAQEFARTSTGLANSTKILNAKFADMETQVGQTLKNAITPLLGAIVELASQAPNTSNSVGKLTEHYRELIAAQKDQIEAQGQQNDLFYDLYSIVSPQDRAIHDFTGTLAGYTEMLGVSRKELALLTEAALTYGKSFDDIRAELKGLYDEALKARQTDMLRGAFETLTKTARQTAGSFHYLARSASTLTRSFDETLSALAGIVKGSLARAKDEAKKGMADIIWSLKHPMKEAQLEHFYANQVRAGTNAMNRALASGNASAYAKAKAFVADYKAKLAELRLESFHVTVTTDFVSKMGSIPGLGSYANAVDTPAERRAERRNRRKRAAGGPVAAGGTYLVGERGPELLTMGGRGGNITPNNKMGANYTINVNIAPGGDLVEAGRQTVRAIRAWERRSGAVWRAA